MSAYLLGNLIFISVWLILFIAGRQTRKLQLFGSFLLLPFAILDIWFRSDYWHPPLIIKAIEPLSLETFLYCFTAGGITIVFGQLMLKNVKGFKINFQRIGIFLAAAFTLYFIFEIFTKINSMNALNFSFLIIWIGLLASNLGKNYLSILPGIILVVFTIFAVNIGSLFYPSFVGEYWNLEKLWPPFFGTPTEEILFAGILGALWALLPRYLLLEEGR